MISFGIYCYLDLFFRHNRAVFVLLPLVMLCVGIFDSFGIMLFFPLLESLQSAAGSYQDSPPIAMVNRFVDKLGIDTIGGICALIAGVFVVKFAINFLNSVMIQSINFRMYRTLSRKIVSGWLRADYQKLYLSSTTGFFCNVLTRELVTFLSAFSYLNGIALSVAYISVYFSIMLFMNPRVTGAVVLCGCVSFFLLRSLMRLSRRYSMRLTQESASFQSKLVEFMSNFKYIKVSPIKRLHGQFDRQIQKITSFRMKIGVIGSFITVIPEPLAAIFVILFVYVFTVFLRGDIAAIAIFLVLFYRMFSKILSLQGSWQRFVSCAGSFEAVFDTIEKVDQLKEKRGEETKRDFRLALRFDRVRCAYNEKTILENLNMSFPSRKTIALVGPSGVGKTTIVDMLTGLLRPADGRILIDDIPYEQLDLSVLREIMGYVTQEVVMFSDNIANNISLWDDSAGSAEKIRRAAHMSHAAEFIEKLPAGYDTHVGDRGINLSVGQRQRIAIARELYREPQILILDEATSALDTESENCIRQTIAALKGKMTLIIIAHRLSTVKHADHIYVIEEGTVKEEGPFDRLYADKSTRFYEMCQMQSF